MKIAVLGASGIVGRALLPLLAGEHEVVAVSRRPRDRSGDGVRWVAADVTERDELDGLFDGVDVVYHLVHSLGAKDFAHRDRLAADAVAEASESAGVRQIVFLGGLGDASKGARSTSAAGRRLLSGSPLTRCL